MTARAAIDVSDLAHLPPRLTRAEVLALARYSDVTLRRRQKAGKFPKAVERGLFLRDQVLEALGKLPKEPEREPATEEPPPRRTTYPPSCVYFFRAIESGKIKIGVTTCVLSRLSKVSTDCPEPVEILGVIAGGADLEGKLHQAFEKYHHIGEWFRGEPLLLEFIAEACGKR